MKCTCFVPGDLLADIVVRVIDTVVATIVLLFALPVLAVAAAAVGFDDGRPLFFCQERVGKNGRPFQLIKLRSMRINRIDVATVGQVRGDHHLVTRPGRFIRRFKIDELPQLVNVILGDMSLVGPRPTVADQVEGYDWFQRRRLRVRPGMTGWAQVNGNVELTWYDRILLDVWYVDHRSLLLDAKILFRTIQVVLRGESPNANVVEIARRYANSFGRRGR